MAYDESGNVSKGITSVFVIDSISPTILANDTLMVFLDDIGELVIDVNAVTESIFDNCSIDTVGLLVNDNIVPVDTLDCSDIGFLTIEVGAIDHFEIGVNVTSERSIVLQVKDTLAPIVMAKDTFVYLDENGAFSVTSDLSNALNDGSTDNCTDPGAIMFTMLQTEFDCSDIVVGGVTVEYTAVDNYQNSSSTPITITVLDTIAPIVVCDTALLSLNLEGVAMLYPSDIDDGSTDNCEIDSMYVLPAIFDCEDIGVDIPVVLYVVDIYGNIDSCQTTVDVEDNNFDGVSSFGPVFGPEVICAGDPAILTYAVPAQSILQGFDYTWTYNGEGLAIISGQGTNSIDVQFSASATAGHIVFTSAGPCSSISDSLEVTIANPAICQEFSCIDTVILTQFFLAADGHDDIFRADQLIKSDGIISAIENEDIEFLAGESVELLPGFEVQKGAEFLADIEPCVEINTITKETYDIIKKQMLDHIEINNKD